MSSALQQTLMHPTRSCPNYRRRHAIPKKEAAPDAWAAFVVPKGDKSSGLVAIRAKQHAREVRPALCLWN